MQQNTKITQQLPSSNVESNDSNESQDKNSSLLKSTIASQQYYPTTMAFGVPNASGWEGSSQLVQDTAELPKEPGIGLEATFKLDWENSFIPKLYDAAAQPFLGPQEKEEWKKERQNTIDTLNQEKQLQATTTADKILDGTASFAAQGALFAGGAAALTALAPEALTAAIGTATSAVGLDAIAGTTAGKLGAQALAGGALSVLGDEFNNVTTGATGDPTVSGHEITYNALLGAGIGLAGGALHLGANKLWQKYKLKNAPQEELPPTPAPGNLDKQVNSDHLEAASNGEVSDDMTLHALSENAVEEVNSNPQAANDLVTEEPKLINRDMENISFEDSIDPKYDEDSLDHAMIADKIDEARDQIDYMKTRDIDIDKGRLELLDNALFKLSGKTYEAPPQSPEDFLSRYSTGDIPNESHELIAKAQSINNNLTDKINNLPDSIKEDLLGLDDKLKNEYLSQAKIDSSTKSAIKSQIESLESIKEKIPHQQLDYLDKQIRSQDLQRELNKLSDLYVRVGDYDATKVQIDRAGNSSDLANRAVQNVSKRSNGEYNLEYTPPVEGVIGQPFNTQPITENQIFDQLRDDYESGNMSAEAIDNMKDILINEVAAEGDEDFFKATARCMTGQQLGEPNIDLKNKIDRIKNLQEGDKWPL